MKEKEEKKKQKKTQLVNKFHTNGGLNTEFTKRHETSKHARGTREAGKP